MLKAVAIHSQFTSNEGFVPILNELLLVLKEQNVRVYLNDSVKGFVGDEFKDISYYENDGTCIVDIDFIISLGGDGTFLKTVACFTKCQTPIVGVNAGRLGFLADVTADEIREMVAALKNGEFEIENRSLLELKNSVPSVDDNLVALNEITVQKSHSSHFLKIHTFIDDVYMTTYWSDGLVLATPTGSTAYSLSLGGPIISPQAKSIVLTPIAPHTLTARPLVLHDDAEVAIVVEGRNNEFLVSLDSNSYICNVGQKLVVHKSKHSVPVVKLLSKVFYETLRSKLMWGADLRT